MQPPQRSTGNLKNSGTTSVTHSFKPKRLYLSIGYDRLLLLLQFSGSTCSTRDRQCAECKEHLQEDHACICMSGEPAHAVDSKVLLNVSASALCPMTHPLCNRKHCTLSALSMTGRMTTRCKVMFSLRYSTKNIEARQLYLMTFLSLAWLHIQATSPLYIKIERYGAYFCQIIFSGCSRIRQIKDSKAPAGRLRLLG